MKPIRLSIPIRLKMLFTMLVFITAVVSAIVFTMANMFHADKTTYVRGLTAEMAIHIASEAGSVLNGYHKRLKVFSHVLFDLELHRQRKTGMIEKLFTEYPEFLAVTIYHEGKEIASVYDLQVFQEKGLTKKALQDYRQAHPLPLDRIRNREFYIENSTISKDFPMLTLAIPYQRQNIEEKSIVTAAIRLEDLIRLVKRSKLFLSFIVDHEGMPLIHPDANTMWLNKPIQWVPDTKILHSAQTQGFSIEFSQNNIPMMGAVARLGFGDYLAGVQIPSSAAYLTSKELLKNLALVALVILAVAALISFIWSHYITRSIGHLSNAAKRIGKGDFNIKVKAPSSDEIGELFGSFNHMAHELNARDIALKETQSALIQSEKMAAFGQIGAGIAHEIKNPIAGILGLTQVCLRKTDETSLLGQNLGAIEKEAKRCKNIIENLLKFARQEEISMDTVDIGQVIEDTLTMMGHQFKLQKIKVDKQLTDNLPQVTGNAVQLQQVLLNILVNAAQAIDNGDGSIHIRTGQPSKSQIEIRIADTGPGLPEEDLAKIFEPFFTTKETGQGTGLGLSVSYGIIKTHKGSIRVKNMQDKGTEFIITLPAQQAM